MFCSACEFTALQEEGMSNRKGQFHSWAVASFTPYSHSEVHSVIHSFIAKETRLLVILKVNFVRHLWCCNIIVFFLASLTLFADI